MTPDLDALRMRAETAERRLAALEQRLSFVLHKREQCEMLLEQTEAERDAALAELGRLRAILEART